MIYICMTNTIMESVNIDKAISNHTYITITIQKDIVVFDIAE